MEESAALYGLGNLTKAITFDLRTLAALRNESGPDEAKVFNLVRGLQKEVESESGLEAVLLPLKERAEHVLKGLEERTTSGLAAMDMLEALAKEKEATVTAARESPLPRRAFGVYWTLKDDAALQAAEVSAMEFAEEAHALVDRFPNAPVNTDEQRRLRDFAVQSVAEGRKRRTGPHRGPSPGDTAGRRCRCGRLTRAAQVSGNASRTGRSASTSPHRVSESVT